LLLFAVVIVVRRSKRCATRLKKYCSSLIPSSSIFRYRSIADIIGPGSGIAFATPGFLTALVFRFSPGAKRLMGGGSCGSVENSGGQCRRTWGRHDATLHRPFIWRTTDPPDHAIRQEETQQSN
jgi:hypothetical protein